MGFAYSAVELFVEIHFEPAVAGLLRLTLKRPEIL